MIRRLPALALLCTLTIPAMAGAREPVQSLSSLGDDEVLVVGRVDLEPPLHEHEQRIRGIGTGRFKNKVFLVVDEEYRILTEEPGRKDFKGRIDATLGEDFRVRSSKQPFFILAGMMYLSMGDGGTPDPAYFPGGLEVDIRPGDRAVYIGTIRYHRNEFFEITRVEIVDDYDRAHGEFLEALGDTVTLRKALMKPVEPDPTDEGEPSGPILSRTH